MVNSCLVLMVSLFPVSKIRDICESAWHQYHYPCMKIWFTGPLPTRGYVLLTLNILFVFDGKIDNIHYNYLEKIKDQNG